MVMGGDTYVQKRIICTRNTCMSGTLQSETQAIHQLKLFLHVERARLLGRVMDRHIGVKVDGG